MSTALLIVDVQHDFLPGGALAVPDGDEVLDALEAAAPAPSTWSSRAATRTRPTTARSSAQGGIWPPHCVEGTHGAELHPTSRRSSPTSW